MTGGYYTSGEFARRANVTIRTIRFYDKQGILKPSKVSEAGYRLYTDEDFGRLQKILSLKYLGFSLEEIMALTIHDDKEDIANSLKLQKELIHKRIRHLEMMERTLEDTLQNALRQIEERGYDAGLKQRGIEEERIRRYGFAFEGKNVLIGGA